MQRSSKDCYTEVAFKPVFTGNGGYFFFYILYEMDLQKKSYKGSNKWVQ